MSLPTSPESRGETYLAAIAGQDVTLPASPESRMEQYLEDIAEKMPVANPTLAGTEDNLTGLEVRGVKYKVPEGGSTHLYQHNIFVGDDNGQVAFYLITNSDTEFTVNTLIDYLKSCLPSGSSSRKYICSSGFGVIGSTKYILELILVSRDMTRMTASARNPSSGAVSTYTFYNGDPECVDFVIQIL